MIFKKNKIVINNQKMSSFNISNDEMIKELYKAEEEINLMINLPNSVQNGFKEYGIINSKWLENYINYLKNSNNSQMEGISFNIKDIIGEKELKDYSYIDNQMILLLGLIFHLYQKKLYFLYLSKIIMKKRKIELKIYCTT